MKKLLLTFSLIVLTTLSFAQTVNYILKGGANLSSVSGTSTPLTVNEQKVAGFQLGLMVDVGFQNFSIQPGLLFITKGGKFTEEFDELYAGQSTVVSHGTGKTNVQYFEIPLNLLYKEKVAQGVRIYLGGGPYVDYGVSGTDSFNVPGFPNYDYNGSITFGSNGSSEDRQFNYGINFIAGVELKKHFTVDLNYGLGLTNVTWGDSGKNRTLGLSVGYLF